MKHSISSKIKKYSKLNISSSISKKIIPFIIIFVFIFLSLISIFFVTRGDEVHASELSFIENSILGKDTGSVIPASCESSPWITSNGDGNVTGCVQAVCGNTVNTCTTGNLGATAEYSTAYQWWCNSAGGNILCNRNISSWTSYCTGGTDYVHPYQIWAYRTVDLNPTQYRFTGSYCTPPTVQINFN